MVMYGRVYYITEKIKQKSKDKIKKIKEKTKKKVDKISNKDKKKQTKKRTPRKKTTKKVDKSDFMHGIRLDPQEKAELKLASKFDKEKGLDKPKDGYVLPKAPKFEKVSIRCMLCGKSFKVAPALIPPERDRFKCNSCCSMRGSH